MADKQTKISEDDIEDMFRTLTPLDEAEVKEILSKKWQHEFKFQNILSVDQQKQMKKILKKKWFFQRPLYGFPVERPAKVVENFMKKTIYVQPNFYELLKKQEDTLNNVISDDKEWYFDLMEGRKDLEEGWQDEKNRDCEEVVLSEEQTNQLNELLESEKKEDNTYLEEHPEVEGIIGVLYSNLCYYRPPDPLQFVKALFGSCESCLRGNVSSYLSYKNKPKTVNPFDIISSGKELTDWRKVMQRLVENEQLRLEEEKLKLYLDEGNDDDLMKAYKKIVQKKRNEVGVQLIDSILDQIIAREEVIENEMKIKVVEQIMELVLDDIFGGSESEEYVKVLRERSKEICKVIIDSMLDNVISEVDKKEEISLTEKKSGLTTNIIEIVVSQIFKEAEDNKISKMLEGNKDNMISQIIESVFNTIFGEPVKLEDRLTSTDFDLIIKAADKVMRCYVEGEKPKLIVKDSHFVF